jgi:hypothetical protein
MVAEAKANPKELTLGLSPNDAANGNCESDAFRARLDPFIAELRRFKIASLSEGHNEDEWIKNMKTTVGE